MARIDENQEAIARTRMAVDNYDKAMREQQPADDEVPVQSEYVEFTSGQRLWALGAVVNQSCFIKTTDVLQADLSNISQANIMQLILPTCLT